MINFRLGEYEPEESASEKSTSDIEKTYNVVDGSKAGDDKIIDHFKQVISNNYDPRKTLRQKFYGGITNDIPSNLSRHGIERYLACIKVESAERAAGIEQRLHDDLQIYIGKTATGGRGKADDSKYIYIADRSLPGFQD